jgi:hypothetical protein
VRVILVLVAIVVVIGECSASIGGNSSGSECP